MNKKTVVNVKHLQDSSKNIEVKQINKHLYSAGSPENQFKHLVIIRKREDGVRIECNCKFGMYGGEGCVHSLAVVRYILSRKGRIPSFWISKEDAVKQRRKVIQIGQSLFMTVRRGEIIDRR